MGVEGAGLSSSERRVFEGVLRDRLAAVFGASPWLVCTEVEQAAARMAPVVLAAGATAVLGVGARPTSGPIDDTCPLIGLDLPPTGSLMGDMASADRAFVDPPPEAQARVDAWDPERRARVLVSLTGSDDRKFDRPTFGARRPTWRALEDKLLIEDVWRAAGIDVVPSAQVAADDRHALIAAHERLAAPPAGGPDGRGGGTVWAGDNAAGWHGGATGTHWVPDRATAETLDLTAAGHDRVRIMPFLEGVACSVHGMVVPDGDGGWAVVAFRPCEMLTLRDTDANRLVYGRAATFWEPAAADGEAMRSVARAIGAELVDRVGFRGVFTVDGVMTAAGFRPTEVNTRYGAALQRDQATVDGPPINLYLLNAAVVEGELDDVDLRPLEPWVTANLAASPSMLGFLFVEQVPGQARAGVAVRDEAGELRIAEDAPEAIATVEWAPDGDGALIVVTGNPDAIPVGPPCAPLLAEILSTLDQVWSIGLPTLVAPVPAR